MQLDLIIDEQLFVAHTQIIIDERACAEQQRKYYDNEPFQVV
jgi:hypothetical protein